MRTALILTALLAATTARAQWEIVTPPPTTADLRGIDNVGKGIVWASGSDGTVLRSEDDGYLWQRCAIPPGAEHLDFRGIQAFDANTAIVMSSGKGPLSHLYKTTDGCQTWTLVFTNPDPEGFWDAIWLESSEGDGYLLGDPANGSFRYWETGDNGVTWQDTWDAAERKHLAWGGLNALPQEGAFAASDSALFVDERYGLGFVTGGPTGGRLFPADRFERGRFHTVRLPLRVGSVTSGAYSIVSRDFDGLVAVGGDYLKPNQSGGTAAYSRDGGEHWRAAITPPHGFRSAVAYDAATKTWITVGPNGTDISTDDGRNWRALKRSASDPPDADQHWNALSLPFVVGPKGRIGRLREGALKGAGEAGR
jgi:photosystem II stability/assembly factor-like uncharacterized protein